MYRAAFTLIDPRLREDDAKIQGFTLIDPRLRRDDIMVQGFTLIELLVVIAILAVLAVVVVLTLNPAGLLQESRDANRLSDVATLKSAIGAWQADGGIGIGTANTIYVSIPDPSATSTAGDQCQGLNLLSLPLGYTYQCASLSNYRNTNGTGWIPINLSQASFGTPLPLLPVDPVNTSSSRLYYTYAADSTGHFEVTAAMEASRDKIGGSADKISGDGGLLATVYESGSKLGLEPLDYGDVALAGYWPFNEGTGSVVYDDSGNNATGSWNGTGTHWAVGNGGAFAGQFATTTSDYVSIPQSSKLNIQGPITISAWILRAAHTGNYEGIVSRWAGAQYLFETWNDETMSYYVYGTSQVGVRTAAIMPINQWVNVVGVYDQNTIRIYYNGVVNGLPVSLSQTPESTNQATIIGYGGGGTQLFNGLIDDVRIYNRALSATEVAAMYAGGK